MIGINNYSIAIIKYSLIICHLIVETKRINILYVIDGLFQGGKERQFIEILKGLDKDKFRIGIVTFNKNLFYTDQAKLLSEYFVELDKKTNKFKPFFTIWACFRAFKPDIVHTWDYLSSLFVYFPIKLCSAKFINGSIRDSGIEKGWQFYAKKRMLKVADLAIGNSKAGLKNYGVKGEVVYNAIDLGRFNRKEIRNEFNIIKVANFSDYKNHQMFIEAAIDLVEEKIVDKVYLAGNGVYMEKYKNFIKEQGEKIAAKFLFLGAISNVESYLEKCVVGVLCSTEQYGEGVSNSVLEYMAAGIIAVATNIGATSEIIQDGDNGFLVSPNSPDEIVDKVKQIKNNPETSVKLIANALRTIELKFNYSKNLQKINHLYDKVLVK